MKKLPLVRPIHEAHNRRAVGETVLGQFQNAIVLIVAAQALKEKKVYIDEFC